MTAKVFTEAIVFLYKTTRIAAWDIDTSVSIGMKDRDVIYGLLRLRDQAEDQHSFAAERQCHFTRCILMHSGL